MVSVKREYTNVQYERQTVNRKKKNNTPMEVKYEKQEQQQ